VTSSWSFILQPIETGTWLAQSVHWSGYGLVLFPKWAWQRTRNFSFLQNVHPGCGAHPTNFSM